jgi:hypothetical protein
MGSTPAIKQNLIDKVGTDIAAGTLKQKSELTPELSEKIFKAFQKKRYDDKVSKEIVLHYLKQLKAQMGKASKDKWNMKFGDKKEGIEMCMKMIDKKIAKINK